MTDGSTSLTFIVLICAQWKQIKAQRTILSFNGFYNKVPRSLILVFYQRWFPALLRGSAEESSQFIYHRPSPRDSLCHAVTSVKHCAKYLRIIVCHICGVLNNCNSSVWRSGYETCLSFNPQNQGWMLLQWTLPSTNTKKLIQNLGGG